MKFLKPYQSLFIGFMVLAQSCVVTNNTYLDSAIPLGSGSSEEMAAIGTGFMPIEDSIGFDSSIHYNRAFYTLGNICGNFRMGLGPKTNGNASLFLMGFGGFGLKMGVQHTLIGGDHQDRFFAALGAESGFSLAADSFNWWIFHNDVKPPFKGSFTAAASLPISIKFSDEIVLTSSFRYGLNSLRLNKDKYLADKYWDHQALIAMSVNLRLYDFILEGSLNAWDGNYYPHFSLAYVITSVDRLNF